MEIKIEEWYSQLQQYASERGQAGLPPQDSLESLYDIGFTPAEAYDKLWPPAPEVIEVQSAQQVESVASVQEESTEVAVAASIEEPRVSEADIMAKIVRKTFTLLPGGTTIVCEITMRNGQVEHGQSIMSSTTEAQTTTQAKALQKAIQQVWGKEQYLLRELLYQQEMAKLRASTVAIEHE